MPELIKRRLETFLKPLKDEKWKCRYLIVGATKLVAGEGHAPGSYATREEAEVAALMGAQRIFDTRPN